MSFPNRRGPNARTLLPEGSRYKVTSLRPSHILRPGVVGVKKSIVIRSMEHVSAANTITNVAN